MNLSLYKTCNLITSRVFTNRMRLRDSFSQTNSINITLLFKKSDPLARWLDLGSNFFPAGIAPAFLDDFFLRALK